MKKIDPVLVTIKTYDKMANDYKRRYRKSNDQNVMKPYLDKFLSMLQTSKKVLDIGSGAGFDAKYLSDNGCDVIGIDLSVELLKIAKDIAPMANFRKMDMREMNFPLDCFDGVWALDSFLHIPKTQMSEVLFDTHKILKRNGIMFTAFKQGTGERFVINKGADNLQGAKRFFAFYEEDEIRSLLKKAGFRILELTENTNRGNVWLNILCKKESQD